MGFIYPILSLVGLYFAFGCGPKITAALGGDIWGIEVSMSAQQKAWKIKNTILFIAGLAVFLLACGPSMRGLYTSLFSGIWGIVAVFAYASAVPIVAILRVYRAAEEITRGAVIVNDTNASVLGELPLMQQVESQLKGASSFAVAYDGIRLIDGRDRCFATELYQDHGLDPLTSAKEVALIGMYFMQKYHDEFHFKTDFEHAYYPSQAETFVGIGGICAGGSRGTMDSKLKSYIFYRK